MINDIELSSKNNLYSKSEKIKAELQKELDELKNTMSLDMEEYHEVLTSEARLKQEVEELKSRLDEYDEKYGIKDPGDDPLHILTTKIEEAERKIEKIESECDYLRKVCLYFFFFLSLK